MYLGVDLGTSAVKVLVVDELGNKISEASSDYPIIFPKPTWTEQNPSDWLNATIKAIKEATLGIENEVKAISFSGQMHGLVLLDDLDRVIRPAILWNDQRTISEVDYLNNVIGKETLLNETGNIAITGFTLPKLLWVKTNEPNNYKKIKKVMLPKDYIAYKLTNIFASDVSDLSGTLLFDVENKKYSKKMIELTGLTKDIFPKILESYEVVGSLTKEMQETLTLSSNVKVIIGGSDQSVGAVGTGTVTKDLVNISLGTSGVVFVSSDEYKVDKKTYLHSFNHSNNKYFMMGVTLSAAGSFDWWKKNFNEEIKFNELFNDVSQTSIEDSLYFLPYLSGERAPINDPYAKGTLVGFNLSHNKKHFTRAIIEGINYSLKSIFEIIKKLGINANKVRITGGGAKNDNWCQMIADTLNVTVETIKINEGPALGAAILAMVGDNKYESVEEAVALIIKPEKSFKPNYQNNLLYEKKYQNYLDLYKRLESFYKNI